MKNYHDLMETVALPELKEGEVYAGLILKKTGTPDYHLILLHGELDAASHNCAISKAGRVGIGRASMDLTVRMRGLSASPTAHRPTTTPTSTSERAPFAALIAKTDHFDHVRELLGREHLDAPKLVLSERIKRIEDPNEIRGAFERIDPTDITLEGYQSHAAIKAPMAA